MAGIVRITNSSAFTGLAAYLKPFFLPQPMNTLYVHTPAFQHKQGRDPPIPEPRPAKRQATHLCNQTPLFLRYLCSISLTRTGLAHRPTDPTLGIPQPLVKMLDALPPTGRGQEFFELYSIASLRISRSIRWSAIIFLSRWLSF